MDGAQQLSATLEDEIREAIPEEERSRAELYLLLSRFLAAPPDDAMLKGLARMPDGDGELGRSFGELARAAAAATAERAQREYHDLFIGVGRGELLPYALFYLAGFLHERPLAGLRGALAHLGVARATEVSEPEDHIVIDRACGRRPIDPHAFFAVQLLPKRGP